MLTRLGHVVEETNLRDEKQYYTVYHQTVALPQSFYSQVLTVDVMCQHLYSLPSENLHSSLRKCRKNNLEEKQKRLSSYIISPHI